MLTTAQRETLWQNKMAAEARACYFGEFANWEGSLKRTIGFITLFASSGAAVSLLSKGPNWLPVVLSLAIAFLSTYTTATNQDGKIKTLGRLHLEWLRLEHDYDRLWSHFNDEDAESEFDRCLERERDLSETAATEIPHKSERWKYWLDTIHKKYDTSGHDRT